MIHNDEAGRELIPGLFSDESPVQCDQERMHDGYR